MSNALFTELNKEKNAYYITILTDKTSWMNEYNSLLKDELELMGYRVKLIFNKNELTKGEIAFFLSCYEIISANKLKLHNHNIVVHASKLPEGKGWSPASWQILEGKNEIPLTLFEASEAVDAGDIYLEDVLHLDGYELISEWRKKLGLKIIDMCLKYVKDYNTIKAKPQCGKEFFYPKRTPKDSRLDINKTIMEQFNLLRIVDNKNYPAYFEYNGKVYTLNINLQ